MKEIFEHGGPVMTLIVIASVVGLGFVVERALAFWRAGAAMDQLFPELENRIRLGELDGARARCADDGGLIPQLIAFGLEHRSEGPEAVKQLLADELQVTALPRLEKHLAVIAVIARISPMLGLLGTVMGMIAMFQEISTHPQFEIGDISRGIFRALGTTAAGLVVAIPLITSHAYFSARIERFEVDCHKYLTRFVRLLSRRQELGGDGAGR